MLDKLLTALILKLLKKKIFKDESRVKITNYLLESIKALPLRGTIFINDSGTAFINGKKLDAEATIQLRNSAIGLKDSFALRVIHEQVRFQAIQMGVHQALTSEQMLFAKAALWFADEEIKLIHKLSGTLSTGE